MLLEKLAAKTFLLDGELLVEGEKGYSFSDLQMRLHPAASRVPQEPGFTGNAPGAPSRWSTERSAQWKPLSLKLVVEISFDHVTDGRFYHGTKLIRFRPDKSPRQCTMEELRQ